MKIAFLMGYHRNGIGRLVLDAYPLLFKCVLYLKICEQVDKIYFITAQHKILELQEEEVPHLDTFASWSLAWKENFFYTYKVFLQQYEQTDVLFVGDTHLFTSLKALCPKAVLLFPKMKPGRVGKCINEKLKKYEKFINLFV
jgi:hypothetical protein